MREIIIRLGRIKTVMLITFISIISSPLIYVGTTYLIGYEVLMIGIIDSVVIPLLIAPTISWYFVGSLFEIHHLEVEMRQLATYDSLTKVMSRHAFLTNAETIYQLMRRNDLLLAMIYIDIDDFKAINDGYGHAVGDELLRSFGDILNANKRKSDLVARLGGEEFVILLPRTGIEGSMSVADNVRDTVNKETIRDNSKVITYTVSMGISIFSKDNEVDLEALLKQSDKALYKAKRSGKDRIAKFDGEKR